MCGITGIISVDSSAISRQRLEKMTKTIAYRGPDGEGYWLSLTNHAGFGHKRLSIIDLSGEASQPMHFLDRYTIVFNGEIYNYIELREDLKKKGFDFRTASDTEVILAAFACYGEDCPNYLDGMFAFAIWDEREKKLFAARDRFGEKPFYYSIDEKEFRFASERKALWADGVPKQINKPLLLNYLVLGYTQTAADTTIGFFQDIFSLPPAHSISFELVDFSFRLNHYWDIDKQAQVSVTDEAAIQRWRELFAGSLSKRLRSDVPIATSLSGGLDSSSIIAMLQQVSNGRLDLKTFSAVFPGFEKDESSHIREVCRQFNLVNHSVSPSATDFIDDFEKLCYHQEEPFSSSSVFLQYKVYELAGRHGIKVLLDGQGADETLAGYSKYLHWHLQGLLPRQFRQMFREKKALRKNNQPLIWGWKNWLAVAYPAQATARLEKLEARKLIRNPDITDAFKQENFDRQSVYKPLATKLNDILYFNTCQFGLEELLRYADRNSMAHGAEVRLPFLNHELVQFAFSLPPSFKIREGWTKWVLRKAMSESLPGSIVWRKDKVGYEPPQKKWMQEPVVSDYIHEAKKILVQKEILKPGILDKKIQPLEAHAADNYDWRWLVAAWFLKQE